MFVIRCSVKNGHRIKTLLEKTLKTEHRISKNDNPNIESQTSNIEK